MNEGRPPVITPDVVRILIEEFEDEATVEFACDEARVSTSAYYEKMKADEEFREKIVRAQNKPLRDAQKSVIKQIRGDPKTKQRGDGQLALRFLERRMPKRYKTQIETRDITPPTHRIIVGTRKPSPMIRPDPVEKPKTAKG